MYVGKHTCKNEQNNPEVYSKHILKGIIMFTVYLLSKVLVLKVNVQL